MKIREQLTPARKRVTSATAAVVTVVLWLILTMPMLPPADLGASVTDAQVKVSETEGERTAEGIADMELNVDNIAAVEQSGRRPIIPATILPSPMQVASALIHLHREEALVRSAAVSFQRITSAFLIAALVAIPLGILMGTYPPVKAAIEPLSGPLRYLPVSAITGLFILLFGIGESMKITFLFVGVVVYLLPIVIESVENVDDVYLETAYTLGAKPWQVISRVLVPAAWPDIIEACRVIYGIGWTYVILAELINAKYGLGYLITIAYRRGHIDWAYALVLVVLLLGVGTNEIFRQLAKRLFAWRETA